MKSKTFLNQYGLMIFESDKSYLIFFNGLTLKLKNKKVNINRFDACMFYEMLYDFKNTLKIALKRK